MPAPRHTANILCFGEWCYLSIYMVIITIKIHHHSHRHWWHNPKECQLLVILQTYCVLKILYYRMMLAKKSTCMQMMTIIAVINSIIPSSFASSLSAWCQTVRNLSKTLLFGEVQFSRPEKWKWKWEWKWTRKWEWQWKYSFPFLEGNRLSRKV